MIHGETMVGALSEKSFEASKRLVEGLVMALEELENLALEFQDCAWRIVLVEEGSYNVIPCGDFFYGHAFKPLFSRIDSRKGEECYPYGVIVDTI